MSSLVKRLKKKKSLPRDKKKWNWHKKFEDVDKTEESSLLVIMEWKLITLTENFIEA